MDAFANSSPKNSHLTRYPDASEVFFDLDLTKNYRIKIL